MSQIDTSPPPSEWSPAPSGPIWNDFTVLVGTFDNVTSPIFRPSSIVVRVGDRVRFQWNSILAPYTIVQAKSVEEPCTRLSDGLYAEAYEVTERMRNDPDIGNGSASYGWYIPYSSSESTIYLYAEGHCEQGTRASFVVSGIASTSPDFTSYQTVRARLSVPAVIGLAVGVTAAVVLIAGIVRLLYCKAAKKDTKMEVQVVDITEGVHVVHDGGTIKKVDTRTSVASIV